MNYLKIAPHTFNWTNVAAGSYSITAKATDNRNIVTTSAPVAVIVNAAPSVSITSPANNAVYAAPATISLAATAADSDGSITKVDFYNGATLLGTATTAPYTFTWSLVAPGSYTVTAKATDNQNVTTTSAPVTVTVNTAATVTLSSPANNATFTAPANVPLAATATGSITQVAFYYGTTLITTLTTAPYSLSWAGVPAGSYTLTAKATDSGGNVTTSAPISISVQAAAPSGMFFIHPDHLNTPRLITDAAGTTVWKWDNDDPFGNNAPNENPNAQGNFSCNLRLPGQYFDRETNLHYNYFRDFDPGIGRYVQSNPIGLVQRKRPSAMLRAGQFDAQLNHLYAYAESNPIAFDDFYGLSTTALEGILIGGARGSSRGLVGALVGAAAGAAITMCERSDREKCEAQCDKDAYRGALFCASMASTYGRKGTKAYANVYSKCIAQVDTNLIECYQDCAKESK